MSTSNLRQSSGKTANQKSKNVSYIEKAGDKTPAKADQLMNMAKSPATLTSETLDGIAPEGTTAYNNNILNLIRNVNTVYLLLKK